MGYQNPCSDGIGCTAKLAISGRDPDNKGGGILFWAYSITEANYAFDAYRAAGYNKVAIEPADNFDETWEMLDAMRQSER